MWGGDTGYWIACEAIEAFDVCAIVKFVRIFVTWI